MMLRTAYVKYYCRECAAIVDHTEITYSDESIMICMLCQNETQVLKDAMKKTYTVMSVRDTGYNLKKRRVIVATVMCKSEADKATERGGSTEVFDVEYPAYEDNHYTVSLCKHPNRGFVDHIAAKAIAAEIKKFI